MFLEGGESPGRPGGFMRSGPSYPPCGLQSPREEWLDPWVEQRSPQRLFWDVDLSTPFLPFKRAWTKGRNRTLAS